MHRHEVLDRIRSASGTNNVCDSCSRDGCRVYMTGVPSPRVVVDADRVFPEHENTLRLPALLRRGRREDARRGADRAQERRSRRIEGGETTAAGSGIRRWRCADRAGNRLPPDPVPRKAHSSETTQGAQPRQGAVPRPEPDHQDCALRSTRQSGAGAFRSPLTAFRQRRRCVPDHPPPRCPPRLTVACTPSRAARRRRFTTRSITSTGLPDAKPMWIRRTKRTGPQRTRLRRRKSPLSGGT